MKEREAQLAKSSRVSLEGLAEQIKQAGVKDLNVIVKGDVQGSVEVIAEDLAHMSTEKVRVRVLHSGVGAITESDVLLASASNAVIIGFNVRPDRKLGRGRRSRERRDPSPLHHLRAPRRDHQGHVRPPRTRLQGELRRPRRSPAGLQDHQGRPDRRLPCHRRHHQAQRAGSPHARRRRRSGRARSAPSSASRTTSPKSATASSAVSISPDYKDIRAGDIIETYTTEKLEDELGRNSAELKKQQLAELKIAKDIENEAARAAAQTEPPPDAANA